MNAYKDNIREDKSKSKLSEVSQRQIGAEPAVGFIDSRPELVRQRKLQKMADDSPQVRRLGHYRDVLNDGPQNAQLQKNHHAYLSRTSHVVQKKQNATGLPDNLKSGIEGLSGLSMDDVKVHYNSLKPAQLNSYAYAQGADIHVGPGQERHLSHEAWHVVQQKQGRVRTTRQLKGAVNVNDDPALEREADRMGHAALGAAAMDGDRTAIQARAVPGGVVQRRLGFEFETGYTVTRDEQPLAKKTPIGTLSGNGWKVEADDSGRMEFIIHPPLEIDASLLQNINSIFAEIDAACQRLEELAKEHRTANEEEDQGGIDDQQTPDDGSFKSDDDGKWLQGILTGTDLLSRAQDQSYESLGEFGDKTEYVGDESGILFQAGGIFEIRAGQSRSLEYKGWRPYALDLAKLIMSFQKDNSGLLKQLNKDK